MTIIKVHDSALQRQVAEGFAIGTFKGDTLLNRKGEWGNNLPPKLIIEEAVEKKEQHQQGQQQSNSKKSKVSNGGAETAPSIKRARIAPEVVQKETISPTN